VTVERTVRALLPFVRRELDGAALPTGVRADVYNGLGPAPDRCGEVEFFVPPHPPRADSVALLSRMPRLRVLQTLSIGVDHLLGHVPVGAALCNGRSLHEANTAELAIGLALAAQRDLPYFFSAQQRGEWTYRISAGLARSNAVIVGHGGVGKAIAQRLAAFDVTTLCVARSARPPVLGIESLPAILPEADMVLLAVPLTRRTNRLVDREFLRAMRDGALLVNVSRGAVVDTDALVAEVSSGRLRAALDVVDPEPLPAGHPLWALPGAIVTPHVGAASRRFLDPAWRLICDQLRRYLAGAELRNLVVDDPDAWAPRSTVLNQSS
jgi:phosphoglycerate dehydrogenase-like enzyme